MNFKQFVVINTMLFIFISGLIYTAITAMPSPQYPSPPWFTIGLIVIILGLGYPIFVIYKDLLLRRAGKHKSDIHE